MDVCPVCGAEVVVSDGVYPTHYRASLFQCEGSGQPAVTEPPKQAVKKAAPRKKASHKK
jgi:hypothetical protein